MVTHEITSTVTQKGQVTIPSEVRKRLGLSTPDKVTFVIDDDGVRLRPSSTTVAELFGSVPPLSAEESLDFEDEIDAALGDMADQMAREIDHG